MNFSFPSAEFEDAVAAVCHGTATEEQAAGLNALLRRDPRARDEYLLRAELHSRLASDPDLFAYAEPAAAGGPPHGLEVENRQPSPVPIPAALPFHRRRTVVLALAACLALSAAGLWGLWLRRPGVPTGSTSSAVAMLTRTVEARWDRSAEPPRVGSALDPGRLRLESGLAQIVFYSGARIVIEGPAELQLVSSREVLCRRGRLLAEVPEPARGFRVRTDHLSVVDLGTAFGVDAAARRTEVHVFRGEVEWRAGSGAGQVLAEHQAVAVRGKDPPQLMAASETAFAAMFDFQQRSLALEAFRYEQWQFANALLNEDPSLLVHLDFQNLGGLDWTLPNTAVHNPSVPEAVIVGCARAEGRWREKQALEFQSVNDRVRLVIPGEYDSLTLSVWVCVMGLDRQFNSLFLSDGFAPGTPHWLIRQDGVLGITVFGETPGEFQIMASPPVLTLDRLGHWLNLAVVLDGRSGQAVHYVNGLPVSRHDLKINLPFRLGAAELGNWNSQSGPRPGPALIRNLSGAIDEFAVFSRALSDAEIRELYAQGQP